MTNKFPAKQVLAGCAILALGAMIIFVWVAFGQGAFKTRRQHNSFNVTMATPTPVRNDAVSNTTKHKEIIEKTHLDDIETDDIEFVKPMKITSHVFYGENPSIKYHYGHFRQKQAESWDQHPLYEIDAFGKKLILELDYDGKFVAPNLHIVTHFNENFTQKTKHDRRLSGCFYTGKIRDEAESSVTVSLCNGMTGYIKAKDSSYYIEPAEKFDEGSPTSIIHRIKKLPHATRKLNDVTFDSNAFYENSENHTIVIDDVVDNPKTHRLKRSLHDADGFEGTCGVATNEDKEPSEEAPRSRRNAKWTNINRISNVSYVKVLIVADRTMVKYHVTQDDLTYYILTIMGHVSFLYQEETIGNAISVSLVRIEVLTHLDFSNTNSAGMLQNFCNWTRLNIQDRSHNVAVLLTRDTICRNDNDINEHCSTLGVARVDSMCQSGCAIVKDKGLATSFTIAHEIGHVLGMPHDEDKKCERFNKGINTNNIMTSVFKRSFTWSPCSSYYVTEFLNSERSNCLSKPPMNDYLPTYAYIETLPGDKIDLEKQCELEFGPGTKVCLSTETSELIGYRSHEWLSPGMSTPCQYLYCFNANKSQCTSTFVPWADGTRCGDRRVCFNGQCRYEHELVTRDGGWGPWEPYGPCSRTCGGGVAVSRRYCDSPKPANGGSYCVGENVRYQSCNTSDCEPGAVEFREKQCADFNGKYVENLNLADQIRWEPDYDRALHGDNQEDYCKLFCIPNKKPSFRLMDKVIDGTKCGPTGFGICVNGICLKGGCDNILGSPMVLDECGICGGDNSRCQEITKTYNKTATAIPNYNKVDRIPKGSSNINISQYSYPYLTKDSTYLVLTDGETGEFLLNGDRLINMDPREIKFGNMKLKYSGANTSTEWIASEKHRKLPKDLIIQVLSYDSSPPNIRYRYIIDMKEAPRYPRYHYSSYRGYSKSYAWRLKPNQPWSTCNSICEGKQYRKPVCMDLLTDVEVKPHLCDNMDDNAIQERDCNMQCQLTWNIASKSACSPQCGLGVRNVYYNCMKVDKNKPNYNELVNEKHCTVLKPPTARETCNTICNSTRWDYSQWSECSKTCGGGVQRRTAKCIDDSNTPIDDSYCNNSELIIEQICNTENCPIWTLAETSSCSRPCGGGYRNLTYYCALDGRIHDDYACDVHSKPPHRELCNDIPCRWSPMNSYHSCSATCGEGVEKRVFVCKTFDSEEIIDDSYCRDIAMPTEVRPCYQKKCDFMSNFFKRRYSIKSDVDNAIEEPFVRTRTYKWVGGDWSTCSQSCGIGGKRKQYFRCLDDNGEENGKMCDPTAKPNNVVSCNLIACPKWKTADWSRTCDANCERYRQVGCADSSGKVVEDYHCDVAKKPQNSTKCKLSECSYIPRDYFSLSEKGDKRYRWKIGPWKPCSNFCGKGTKRRHVQCEDALNELTVVDAFCKHAKKPKTTRPCERYSCKFAWIEGYWSACSASCGTGVKKRNVTCHRVYKGGIVDPVPLPEHFHHNYCSLKTKPPTTSKCILSHCGDQFVWQTEPWKQCSQRCGKKGRQVRAVQCVNAWNKQKVPRYRCRKNLKPPRKRKCNQWKCLYRSCREIKHYTGTKTNRDYVILLHGRPVQIHCYKMDTPEPLEYISLHSDALNYAEIYGKRLNNERSCPSGGQRRADCPCEDIGSARSGFTKFWKVRLDISTMKIIGEDFTFSKQINGTHVPYGTAGDCYSSIQNCAQGQFEIDLMHTSFKLAKSVRWEKLGPYASAQIRRSDTRASGKCGGYCGNCIPDPNIGLAVEIT
ncbi:unnamed protein product [Phyllotreta striolata]|uniref:A disintegrin and metalloproteinase with thrombospondin motifs 9 n=1 Tax=Phyllotreta striolata TaxID=444603 RepID=A0A9N9XPM7_PHYSR|nr:unnamed protein product [Phyllotreta striolata]